MFLRHLPPQSSGLMWGTVEVEDLYAVSRRLRGLAKMSHVMRWEDEDVSVLFRAPHIKTKTGPFKGHKRRQIKRIFCSWKELHVTEKQDVLASIMGCCYCVYLFSTLYYMGVQFTTVSYLFAFIL
jgi:hypothetical protein